MTPETLSAEKVHQRTSQKRLLPRLWFSLRTLSIFVLLMGSASGLRWRWEPWVLARRWASGNSERIWSASFSNDGNYVITAGGDETVRLWSILDGRYLWATNVHSNCLGVATMTRDGRHILAAGVEGTVHILNATNGEQEYLIRGDNSPVVSTSFIPVISPDGSRILTGSSNESISPAIWDAETVEVVTRLKGKGLGQLDCAAFSLDGGKVAMEIVRSRSKY
jgi:WD40 repeat protein